MSEPKYVDFKPRWMRELSEEDRRILDDFPNIGSAAPGTPRLHTRLVLRGDVGGVSFKTLGETLELTQTVVQYAGCDLVHGVNPDFADLRSAGAEVLQLSKLTADPFEEGSFIIPARLEGAVVEALLEGQRRKVTTQDVVNRFHTLLGTLQDAGPAADVSIGAIQAIEALGRVIRREAETIEYTLFDEAGQSTPAIRVTSQTLARVAKVRESRRSSRAALEMLFGTVTALDIVAETLHLRLYPNGERVKGTFSRLFQQTLVARLGRRVRLYGEVEKRGKRPISIRVESVEVPNEDA